MSGEAYAVVISSTAIDALGDLGPAVERNIARAVNRTIDRARTASEREMKLQVAFPGNYLSPSQGRLTVTQRATEVDPMAVITGRNRPTSLARFATNARQAGQRGARVTVSPGRSVFLPKAFFVRLLSGSDGSNNNLGLAIRLPAGKRPDRAYRPKLIGRNLWLLYGPSVGQVADDVFSEISPDTADFLEQEFLRLTDLDLK